MTTKPLIPVILLVTAFLLPVAVMADNMNFTYLWHMHQPVYWPDASTWNDGQYQTAYESIWLKQNGGNWYSGAQSNPHPLNDLDEIFNKDDRVADYQYYPRNCLASCSDLSDMGAQVSFAGSLIENIQSLADAGWMGGRYPQNWYGSYREARSWTTSSGKSKCDMVGVGFHHAIAPLLPSFVFQMELKIQKDIYADAWGSSPGLSTGFFPAEMCFSQRLIPLLAEEGFTWSFVPNNHISRCCSDYPYNASPNGDQIDPPNPADQVNPSGFPFFSKFISRGCTPNNAYPFAYQPHYAEYINPDSGQSSRLIVVPIAQAMSWDEGYGSYGTGDMDQIAWNNDPARPMLIVFGHDGDNAYSGGHSYFNENVPGFAHQAAGAGYHPSTVQQYLTQYPVPASDVIQVEDGGWVNADGDFGSPQFINWNWPLVNQQGQFDIPDGWAEDERNWAVITAAANRVKTAADQTATIRIPQIRSPGSNANAAEKAWHFLLGSLDSGYMYYGTAGDMEVKTTLACNQACAYADQVISPQSDSTEPAIWIPQRLPYNPGGMGNGSLWGYQYTDMCRDFYVWTFIHDTSGIQRAVLKYREDYDGVNPISSHQNETFAGGSEVSPWQETTLTQRSFPVGNFLQDPSIDFFEEPDYIADEYYVKMQGFSDVLLDYYIEAEDSRGNIARSDIFHVYVGTGDCSGSNERVTWEPAHPSKFDTIRITVRQTNQGGYLHWGVNAVGSDWTTPDESYWPTGSALFQGIGPALESPLSGPGTENEYWIDLGPFDHPEQQVNDISFVLHFDDDSWDNNDGQDYHIPVSQSPVTPSPTPSATKTPSPSPTRTPTQPVTPSATPTPTPTAPPGQPTYTPIPPSVTPTNTPPPSSTPIPTWTPAPDCTDWSASPLMPATEFNPGMDCWLTAVVCNPTSTNVVSCPLFMILEAGGLFFFAPGWSDAPEYLSVTCPPGESRYPIIPSFAWPETHSSGYARFWCAVTDTNITRIRGNFGQWDMIWND